jgi:hypothetical protein
MMIKVLLLYAWSFLELAEPALFGVDAVLFIGIQQGIFSGKGDAAFWRVAVASVDAVGEDGMWGTRSAILIS